MGLLPPRPLNKDLLCYISDTNQSAPLFSFAELVASGSAADSPCQRSLFSSPTSSLRQALHCIGQPLERCDLNFRPVVELRENIETNVFVRIRDHSGYRGDLFRGESIHHVSDMTRRAGIHRLQPMPIASSADIVQTVMSVPVIISRYRVKLKTGDWEAEEEPGLKRRRIEPGGQIARACGDGCIV